MSMNSKQRWMGGVVLLGGGLLLTALLLKGKEEIHQNNLTIANTSAQTETVQESATSRLTVDVATEQRLLDEQRRQREKSVAEQEARAAEFLAMQQQAEADAARKAAEEYATLNALRVQSQQSSDNIPPELVNEGQAKQKQIADAKAVEQKAANEKSEAEKRKADEKKDAERKAQEKKAAEEKAAVAKRKAEEKRKVEEQKEAEHKAAEKKAAAEKHKAEEAKKKAETEKARQLLNEKDDKQWMVQVALASNEANADAIASKLKAKGYKVTKSQTSKGIRIMVGPSKDREAADSARKKISADTSLNMKSAWVLDWVPLDKR